MSSHAITSGPAIDVLVIGGGPAGLAAATTLKKAGVSRVVLLEREAQAGGIPRHCGHPPFGMREFKRVLRGPAYAARLVERARRAGVEIHTNATVAEARPGGVLLVALPEGLIEPVARRVIYATGLRETPRSARLVSGARVGGVMNTGALQSMVYLKGCRPFRRPVIIGSELVAFSAIMTCRHAGIRPVAMIEAADRVTARWPSSVFPRITGVRLNSGTRLIEVLGTTTVEGVVVEGPDGQARRINCDGVVFSGQFTPEASLARCGHLEIDPATGGPLVDQWGRCSDPVYFATGNLLRPVETAGWSWKEGRSCGAWVADDLAGRLPGQGREVTIQVGDPRVKYTMPQKIVLPRTDADMRDLQLRVSRSVRGALVARRGNDTLWRRNTVFHPERRILIPLSDIVDGDNGGIVRIEIEEASHDVR